jgi:hypothetical protein
MTTPDKPNVKLSLVFVTPELARKWLGGPAVPNRKESRPRIEMLRRALRAGRFPLSWDAIAFDESMRRQNGAHRLRAIAEEEIGAWMLVVRGLSDAAFIVGDQGVKRTFTQVLQTRDVKNAGPLAAASRLLWQYLNGHPIAARGSGAAADITALESLFFVERPEFRSYDSAGISLSAGAPLGSPGLGIVLSYLIGRIGEEGERFLYLLETGDGLKVGDPILALRRRLLTMHRQRGTAKGSDATYKAALVIKAWNLWLIGARVEKIGWQRGGRNPEAFPVIETPPSEETRIETPDERLT